MGPIHFCLLWWACCRHLKGWLLPLLSRRCTALGAPTFKFGTVDRRGRASADARDLDRVGDGFRAGGVAPEWTDHRLGDGPRGVRTPALAEGEHRVDPKRGQRAAEEIGDRVVDRRAIAD